MKSCIKYHDNLIGKQFEKLTILEIFRDDKYNGKPRYKARCICKCGKETSPLLGSVTSGNTTSCGCRRDQYSKITGKNSKQFTGYEDISGTLWRWCIDSAKKRKLDFDIDLPYMWELFKSQNGCCALTGIPIIPIHNGTASIDRIDSNLGYIKGNVQWVHKCVNTMKSVYSIQCFKEVCLLVAKKNDWIPNPNGNPYILDDSLVMITACGPKKEKNKKM
ncbi:MAG: hypothetical protein WC516_09060 [Patescibacteria group bacterium]|jgi:hypothetical protein